jgi:hypothetical protein
VIPFSALASTRREKRRGAAGATLAWRSWCLMFAAFVGKCYACLTSGLSEAGTEPRGMKPGGFDP